MMRVGEQADRKYTCAIRSDICAKAGVSSLLRVLQTSGLGLAATGRPSAENRLVTSSLSVVWPALARPCCMVLRKELDSWQPKPPANTYIRAFVSEND